MKRIIPLLLLVALGNDTGRAGAAQNISTEIDLLYPEFAHPNEDVAAAIRRRDSVSLPLIARSKSFLGWNTRKSSGGATG